MYICIILKGVERMEVVHIVFVLLLGIFSYSSFIIIFLADKVIQAGRKLLEMVSLNSVLSCDLNTLDGMTVSV